MRTMSMVASRAANPDETFVLNLRNVTNGRLARPQASCIRRGWDKHNKPINVESSFVTGTNTRS
jgi:hypothetical protein